MAINVCAPKTKEREGAIGGVFNGSENNRENSTYSAVLTLPAYGGFVRGGLPGNSNANSVTAT